MPMRVVEGRLFPEDFTKKFRVKIFPSLSFWRQRQGWRYTLESYWTDWHPEFTSRWYSDKAELEEVANRLLDRIQNYNGPQAEYLSERS